MEHLWTPWRSSYVTAKPDTDLCVFCEAVASKDDHRHFVLHRAKGAFVMLNRFPYTSGHLMIAPNAHVSRLADVDLSAADEIWRLARATEVILHELYIPNGINIGMNIGEAAGAGIAGHIHLHVLPRWTGDANFMTVVGATRVMPELLEDTFQKLRPAFDKL
jgi:ATP adenylyltransferase